MTSRPDIRVALAVPEDRAGKWQQVLDPLVPDHVRLLTCSTGASLKNAAPEIIVANQDDYVLDYLAQAPADLHWVQFMSAGIDAAARRLSAQGFVVTNCRGIHGEAMREHVLAMMLHFAKQLPDWQAHKKARKWQPAQLPLLAGGTCLVVGTGAVGSAIAEGVSALGLHTWGLSRSGHPNAAFGRVAPMEYLHAWLNAADYVVLAAPGTPESRHMLDARAFDAMKDGAILINVARGDLVDEPALIRALFAGKLAGAALDAFSSEPLGDDSPLWDAPNLVITPHIAGRFAEGHARGLALFHENLKRYLAGTALNNQVDLGRGY